MSTPVKVDIALLQRWLEDARVKYYLCGQCDGLHIAALQEVEGMIDSRLFLEPWGLLLTSELEIRPMALLPLAADLGRLNMDYPTLKLFQDVVDDATPQLVAAGMLTGGGGLTLEQVANFLSLTIGATRQLAEECLRLDYLFAQGDGQQPGSTALH